MMTFYAAAGSYQIRSEDGKNMPYISWCSCCRRREDHRLLSNDQGRAL